MNQKCPQRSFADFLLGEVWVVWEKMELQEVLIMADSESGSHPMDYAPHCFFTTQSSNITSKHTCEISYTTSSNYSHTGSSKHPYAYNEKNYTLISKWKQGNSLKSPIILHRSPFQCLVGSRGRSCALSEGQVPAGLTLLSSAALLHKAARDSRHLLEPLSSG